MDRSTAEIRIGGPATGPQSRIITRPTSYRISNNSCSSSSSSCHNSSSRCFNSLIASRASRSRRMGRRFSKEIIWGLDMTQLRARMGVLNRSTDVRICTNRRGPKASTSKLMHRRDCSECILCGNILI